MGWNRTQIANRALGFLGLPDAISDYVNDTSEVAGILRSNFDIALEDVSAEFPWPFHTVVEELAPVGDPDTAYSGEFRYAYRYPANCIRFLGVVPDDAGGARNPTEKSKVEYAETSDDEGLLILTDEENAKGEFLRLSDVGQLGVKFMLVVALRVAMLSGPRLERDAQSGKALMPEYQLALSEAKAHAANESAFQRPPDPPFLRARRGESWPNRRGDVPW